MCRSNTQVHHAMKPILLSMLFYRYCWNSTCYPHLWQIQTGQYLMAQWRTQAHWPSTTDKDTTEKQISIQYEDFLIGLFKKKWAYQKGNVSAIPKGLVEKNSTILHRERDRMTFKGTFNPEILMILYLDSQISCAYFEISWTDYSEAERIPKGKAHQIIRERCTETG